MFFYRILKYIRYRIDRIFNKGLLHQLIVLIIIILSILLIVSLFMKLAFNYPIFDAFWDSLMQFIDTGNISAAESERGVNGIVITFLAVTFFGVCGWGLLIAMINNSLQERIKNLTEGNAFIMERNHSIILGYGEEVLTIIDEFIKGRAKKMVLLSEYDHNTIKKRISFLKNYKKSNIIIRQGNPSIYENLLLLNIEKATSISIVNDNDTESLKILLSLKRIMEESNHKHKVKIDICVLVNKKESIEIISSINDTNFFNIHIIYKYEILYKLIGQSIIYTGLSSIYEELFDIKGIDIEIIYNHNIDNMSFKELSLKYIDKNKILLGLVKKETELTSLYIPDVDYRIKKDDELVVLFRNGNDDDIIDITNHIDDNISYNHNVLIILENNKENEIMKEIHEYVEDKSITKVYYSDIIQQEYKKEFIEKKIEDNKITKIVLISETMETDIEAINLLVIIRRIVKDKYNIPILSLINSIENRNLVYSDDIRDFIVSGKLIGTLMATSSKDSNLLYIFNDLLTKNGSDIIMIPYSKYFGANNEMSFLDIYNYLLNKKKIAIGLKEQSTVILNPRSDKKVNNSYEIIIITDE